MKLIKAEDVQTLPRGRKADFDPKLLKVLGQIKDGNFGVLDEEFGKVEGKDERAKVAQTIRKHWTQVHGATKVTIRWNLEGFPQVGAAKNQG